MRLYRIFTLRQIAVFTAVLLAVTALVFASSGASVSAAGRSQERKLPIYCVGRGEDEKKVVSLTFDAACPAGRVRKA